MSYLFVILSFLLSAAIARFIIPHIFLISLQKRLFDVPDERKIHKRAIPRLGGVAFFPTILFSFCFVLALWVLSGYEIDLKNIKSIFPEFLLFICGMTLLYLTGIKDDLVGVRYSQKFVIQILCACLFPLGGLWINDLYGLFGVHVLPAWLGMPFTVLVVVFITNAINLIDGIDGLASGLSGVALMILGWLFIGKGEWLYGMLSFCALGVLLPFFFYNVFGKEERSKKIFMGDTGSLTLGYVLSFLAIGYSTHDEATTSYTNYALSIAFSTLIVPVFDVVRVILVRLRDKKPLFEPDKNHIHHKFLSMGMGVHKTMVLLLLLSGGFSLSNIWLLEYVDNTLLLVVDVVVWGGLNLWWDRVIKRKHLKLI
jgi:UDP-N-acetylmuramyl pentapeptide phosphotransferase/UDP-N-acetylglucosamine-1-phosphate transferase